LPAHVPTADTPSSFALVCDHDDDDDDDDDDLMMMMMMMNMT
jgi:hypothetical protein